MLIDKKLLRVGMVLEEPLYVGTSKIPLLKAGEVLNEKLIPRIQMISTIQSVRISFDKKDTKETVSTDLQQSAIEALKNLDISSTVVAAEQIVSKILVSKSYSYSLLKYALEERDHEKQALQVCEFAVALGKVYNKTKEPIDLNALATAALLHDIGSVCKKDESLIGKLPEVSLDKNKFTKFDADYMKRSYDRNNESLYAYLLTKDDPSVSLLAKNLILLHDENEDATGALGLNPGNNLNPKVLTMAKMIHVCDLYEKFLAAIVSDPKRRPTDVIRAMIGAAKIGMVNPELTAMFLKNIPLFSIGTRVVLNDGTIGAVTENVVDPERSDIKVESALNNHVSIHDDGFVIELSKIPKDELYITKVYDYEIKDKVDEDLAFRI